MKEFFNRIGTVRKTDNGYCLDINKQALDVCGFKEGDRLRIGVHGSAKIMIIGSMNNHGQVTDILRSVSEYHLFGKQQTPLLNHINISDDIPLNDMRLD